MRGSQWICGWVRDLSAAPIYHFLTKKSTPVYNHDSAETFWMIGLTLTEQELLEEASTMYMQRFFITLLDKIIAGHVIEGIQKSVWPRNHPTEYKQELIKHNITGSTKCNMLTLFSMQKLIKLRSRIKSVKRLHEIRYKL